jgi:hypothetical protein
MITDNPCSKTRNRSNAMTALKTTTRTLIAFFAAMAIMIVVGLATVSLSSSDRAGATWNHLTAGATWNHVHAGSVSAAATWNRVSGGINNGATWN